MKEESNGVFDIERPIKNSFLSIRIIQEVV